MGLGSSRRALASDLVRRTLQLNWRRWEIVATQTVFVLIVVGIFEDKAVVVSGYDLTQSSAFELH